MHTAPLSRSAIFLLLFVFVRKPRIALRSPSPVKCLRAAPVLAELRASPYSAAGAAPKNGALDSGSLRATQGLRTNVAAVETLLTSEKMGMLLFCRQPGFTGNRLEQREELGASSRPPFWLVNTKSEPSSGRCRSHSRTAGPKQSAFGGFAPFSPLRPLPGGRRSAAARRALRTAPLSRQTVKHVCHSPRFHSRPATLPPASVLSFSTSPAVFVRLRGPMKNKNSR